MKKSLPASLISAVDSIASKIIRIARSCLLPCILVAMLIAGFAGDVKAQSAADLPTLSYNAFNTYEAGKYFGNFFPESSNVTAPGFALPIVSVATVAGPAKMVVDTAGNKYFQGAAINELYKYPADGSAAITITHPYQKIIDLAINKEGDLYGVAADGTVFKLPAGSTNMQTIIAGGASIGGIAIDSKGQIYLSKKAEGNIDRYAADGTYIDSPLSGLDAPAALVTDASDVLYISSNYDKIIKYTPGYAFPQNFGGSTFSPVSMSVDPAGYIYAVNSNHSVYRLKPDGSEEQLIYTDPLGQLSTFTLDSKGNAYWGTLDQSNFYTSKPSGGYYINKPLPAGITFDVSTGCIGGKPNAVSPLNNYTVTAYGDTIAATSTFAIKVTSGDAYLASITADSASIEFPYIENQDLLSRVPSGLAALNVTPVTRDITSVITYNGNTYASGATLNIPLNVGDNLVTLLVTATGGTTREYSLTIKKPAPPSISYGNVNPLALNQSVYLSPSGTIPQAFNDFQPYGTQPIFGSAAGSKLPKMVADTAGNRYIASPAQQQIYKYGPNGDTFTTISTAPETGIIDLALDKAGNLYGLSDANIFKVPAGSTIMQVIAAAPAKNALAVDLDGNVFVADSLNKKIIRYDAASAVAADFVSTGDNGPVALAFNGNDQLFVAYNTESGSNILSIPVTGGSLTGIMQQYYPAALAVSPSGVLYVTTSNRIFTFYASPFPTYSSVLYNTDAINAKNIGIDAKGIGYVADSKTASYRKLTPKAGFYLNKPLPKGLTFNMNNGIIMGAPTEQFTPSAYTVTAYNNGEVAATTFTLSTQAAAPGLSAIYASVGTVSPRVSPDVTEYTISVDAGTTQTELFFKAADGESRITVNGDPIPDRGPYIVALNGADQVLAVQVTPAGGGKGMRYKVTVHAPSSESRLGSIALKDGTLTPAFDKDVTTYEVNLSASITNTSINASLLASTGKITINGMDATSGSPFRLSLKDGINPVMITGVSEDNNTQTTYTVNITRASSATGPALSSFSTNAGTLSPAFNPDVTSYTLNLANAESSLSFTLGLADAGSVITVGGDTIPANTPTIPVIVPVGTINYAATITAADGSTRTYTIAVTRAATSPESRLAGIDINVGSLSPGFDKDVTNYTVYLSADMDNVYIAPTLIDPNGTVTINGTQTDNGTQSANFTLNAGDNLFTISGISADGSGQTNYKVNIIRGGEGPASALRGIATSSGTLNPSFDPNNRYYNLETDPEAASITITPTTKDPLSLAYVNAESADGDSGPKTIALSIGDNAIPIYVKSADGSSTSIYSLSVNRPVAITSLGLGTGTLSPAYKYNITSYNVKVPSGTNTLSLKPLANSDMGGYIINGVFVYPNAEPYAVPLNTNGTTTITIVGLKLDDNFTPTYTLNVEQDMGISTLAGITLSGGTLSPSFNSATLNYTTTVTSSTISITPTLTDANATLSVTVNGSPVSATAGVFTLPLNGGENIVAVKVTAQGGSIKTYNLTVLRKLPGSGVSTLTVLTLTEPRVGRTQLASGPADFNSYAEVPVGTTSIRVTPTARNANATIRINGVVVASGGTSAPIPLSDTTLINLKITAQDSVSVSTYQVKVVRRASVVSAQSITFNALSAKTFGDSDFAPGATASSGLVVDYRSDNPAVAVINGGNISIVGAGTANITASQAGNAAYAAASQVVQVLTVNPKTVRVSAAAKSKVYGDTDPVLTFTADALFGSDSFTGALARLAGENAGTYAISRGTLALTPNYNLVFTGADFEIARAPLTIIADSASKFAGNANPALTYKIRGFKGSDSEASFTQPVSISTAANNTSAPGNYPIVVSGAVNANYDISFVNGALSVKAKGEVTLASLTPGTGTLSPAFNKAITAYKLNVSGSTDSIAFAATATDSLAKIYINDNLPGTPIALNVGANTVRVKVYNIGDEKSYIVTVNRAASNNARLNRILTNPAARLVAITGPADYNRAVSVASGTSSISIACTPQQAGAKIQVNGTVVPSETFSAAVPLTGSVTMIDILVTAEDGRTTRLYQLTVNRQPSTNAVLQSIVTTPTAKLSTTIGPADYNRSISLPFSVNEIQFAAIPKQADATIKINGMPVVNGVASDPIPLSGSVTVVNIVVTAQDSITTKTYQITVNRSASTNAVLSSITTTPVARLTTITGPADYNRAVSVGASVNEIKVAAVPQQEGATLKINNVAVANGVASDAIPITGAITLIDIVVTAEDGITTKTYQITVNRKPSTNALLAKIETNPTAKRVNTIGPADYNRAMSVPGSTSSITIACTPQQPAANVTINGMPVANGVFSTDIALTGESTVIDILVTAEDGVSTKTYQLTVNRPAPPTVLAARDRNKIDVLQKPEATTDALPELVVKQALSPNGDGVNDRFTIQGINAFPDNTVRIINRNGDVVYQAKGYDNEATAFDGHGSNGTLQQPGTYFYSIEYKSGDTIRHKSGYLVIKY